jgi:hypothetical protein
MAAINRPRATDVPSHSPVPSSTPHSMNYPPRTNEAAPSDEPEDGFLKTEPHAARPETPWPDDFPSRESCMDVIFIWP